MIEALKQNHLLVLEQGTPLRAEFAFDICDAESRSVLMVCRETPPGRLTRLFRFSEYKRTTPFDLAVHLPDGTPVMRLTRGIPVWTSCVTVLDTQDIPVGSFRQRPFRLSGAFDVLDATGTPVCHLQGRGARREFSFLTPDGVPLATVTKEWAGLRKELLTSADHYRVDIDPLVPEEPAIRKLMFASAICIGMVMKFELP